MLIHALTALYESMMGVRGLVVIRSSDSYCCKPEEETMHHCEGQACGVIEGERYEYGLSSSTHFSYIYTCAYLGASTGEAAWLDVRDVLRKFPERSKGRFTI